MADSVATITVPDMNSTRTSPPFFEARGSAAVGAGDYATGGIVMSLAAPLVKAQRPPKRVVVTGIAGYIYVFVPGTTIANGKLMIFAQTNAAAEDAPLGELAVAAMPAAVIADTINFVAEFLGQN